MNRAKRAALGAAAVAGLAMAARALLFASPVIVTAACVGRECDGDFVEFGLVASEGHKIDENTWESTPIDGRWLDYPHQRTFSIHTDRDFPGRQPDEMLVWISPDPTPNPPVGVFPPASNWTLAGGNLAEWTLVWPGYQQLHNDTCASYYARIVLHFYPQPDAGAASEGGDASDTSDAANDGSTESAADAGSD